MDDSFISQVFGDDFPWLFSHITGIPAGKGNLCRNSLLYDRQTNQYWNTKTFRTLHFLTNKLNIISKAEFYLKLPYKFYSNVFHKSSIYYSINSQKELVFLPSLNGLVVINFSDQKVVKILTPIQAEPDFLDIERKVYSVIPDNVPEIIKSGVVQNKYHYLVWRYLQPTASLSFRDWPQYAPKILDILFQQYSATGLIKKSYDEYLAETEIKLAKVKTQNNFLAEIDEITERIFSLLKFYQSHNENLTLYKLHCHGDLVPNNILMLNDKLYLFDWSLGGWLNAFYDLMIQEFYRPDSLFWKRFSRINKNELFESQYLRAWGLNFICRLEALLGAELSLQEIKIGCLISLLEKSVNSFFRYQHHLVNFENGKYILNLIIKILKNID